MRGFIKFCGGLFVVVGIVGFIAAGIGVVQTMPLGLYSFLAGLTIVFASAGAALIGGTAYMLCCIDHRLEEMNNQSSTAAHNERLDPVISALT